ncbi:hypothetical protein V2J09_004685 [Rumex salicifolius]
MELVQHFQLSFVLVVLNINYVFLCFGLTLYKVCELGNGMNPYLLSNNNLEMCYFIKPELHIYMTSKWMLLAIDVDLEFD